MRIRVIPNLVSATQKVVESCNERPTFTDDLHLISSPGFLSSRSCGIQLKLAAHYSHVLRSIERPLRALSIRM